MNQLQKSYGPNVVPQRLYRVRHLRRFTSEVLVQIIVIGWRYVKVIVRLVAVVGRERLATGGEVVRAGGGAARAGEGGGHRTDPAAHAAPAAALAQQVTRFPHGRSYNTTNTKLFIPTQRTFDTIVTNQFLFFTLKVCRQSWMFDECCRRFIALVENGCDMLATISQPRSEIKINDTEGWVWQNKLPREKSHQHCHRTFKILRITPFKSEEYYLIT